MVTDKEDYPSEQMEHFSRNKKATSDNWTKVGEAEIGRASCRERV